MDDKYQCHICMEVAAKPVVTPCGHLFCWPCIYHWLRSNQQYLTCPICKSGLPILEPKAPVEKADNGVPPRPRPFRKPKPGSRLTQLPKSISQIGMNVQKGVLLAGYGIFPSSMMMIYQYHHFPERNESPFEEEGVEYKLYKKIERIFKLCLLFLVIYIFFI